jgi:hypothetical protein
MSKSARIPVVEGNTGKENERIHANFIEELQHSVVALFVTFDKFRSMFILLCNNIHKAIVEYTKNEYYYCSDTSNY